MIINSDCLEAMQKMESNSISCIVTDPPYGLKFMGKEWDHGIPGIPFWQEMLRICKPGAFLLSFGGTRTFHRLTCAIEDSGWEIRDCLSWLYGSGFPKSHNHFGIEGYGTALKPAWEPIIMAMKPCDGTFKENTEKWGQAGINIDACRVGTETTETHINYNRKGNDGWQRPWNQTGQDSEVKKHTVPGRWPANIILDEEAATMLDKQTGVLKSGKPGIRRKKHRTGCMLGTLNITGSVESGIGDSGGASRFFYCAKASSSERNKGLDEFPDVEHQTGCGGSMPFDDKGKERDRFKKVCKNFHPTVKPLKLMEYLITLVMPPKDGILLDPFAGSGTTILAAQNLGFEAIGIEKDADYCKIAEQRLANQNLFSIMRKN